MATSSKKSIQNLLIVESPSKAKTIKKYLGSGFEVLSSVGHVRDLPKDKFGVDVDKNFTPEYIVPRKGGKAQIVKELKEAAASSKNIFLATDPDREGEAISWHLAEILDIDKKAQVRVTFNEITKDAVKNGIQNPRCIDEQLFNAQQARRVLDRIVGYKASPFLWHKLQPGLSAGRVQTVATRLIVDREREIEKFVPAEYWTIEAAFKDGRKTFTARFFGNPSKITIDSKESLDKILMDLNNAEYKISNLQKAKKQKQPRPPFTTSTLQQEASTILNMRPQNTMRIAQALYEGIDIKGRGLTGLITYMRTDSVRISSEAAAAAMDYIDKNFGKEYVPTSPHTFKTKKNAQDAHEAIRPSVISLAPDDIKDSLSAEQYKLYKLIWNRFMSSQMSNAVYDTVNIDISADKYLFKANDSKIVFNGFTILYEAQKDQDDISASNLPDNLEEGMILKLDSINPTQKFTQPPSRYTEASLVKTFEEYGIARPSTYATIISTIQDKGYVVKEGKLLKPTALGFTTNDLMCENFKDIVDVKFTANMEKQLDEIADGNATYLKTVSDFYDSFMKELDVADKSARKIQIESDIVCELCGRKMVYKSGPYGQFLGCSGYPECKNTKPITEPTKGFCPKCGKPMVGKKSRRSKNKTFYTCEDSKNCNFITWDLPIADKCEKCGKTMFKQFYKIVCLNEGCGFEKPLTRRKPSKTKKNDEE